MVKLPQLLSSSQLHQWHTGDSSQWLQMHPAQPLPLLSYSARLPLQLPCMTDSRLDFAGLLN